MKEARGAFAQSMCFSGLAPQGRARARNHKRGAAPVQCRHSLTSSNGSGYRERLTSEKRRKKKQTEGERGSTPALEEGRAFLGCRPNEERRETGHYGYRGRYHALEIERRWWVRHTEAGNARSKQASWTRRESIRVRRKKRRQSIADPGLFQWRSSF